MAFMGIGLANGFFAYWVKHGLFEELQMHNDIVSAMFPRWTGILDPRTMMGLTIGNHVSTLYGGILAAEPLARMVGVGRQRWAARGMCYAVLALNMAYHQHGMIEVSSALIVKGGEPVGRVAAMVPIMGPYRSASGALNVTNVMMMDPMPLRSMDGGRVDFYGPMTGKLMRHCYMRLQSE